MWQLIYRARGFDFLKATVDALLDEPSGEYASGHEISQFELIFQQSPPGTLFSEAVSPKPVDALYHEYRYSDGETILPINGQLEVVGYYVREVPTSEAVKFEKEKL
jgi:hypothetical protein